MVILVNENDEEIGVMPKLEAHEKGLLHRAFSVLLVNSSGELLLQQRALHKYHTPGLWTNTCCSHPRAGESTMEAAHRRLKEEMGMDAPLRFLFKFTYRAPFDNGLAEHEIDHVFLGCTDQRPDINPEEVAGFRYTGIDKILAELKSDPEAYTPWFKILLTEYGETLKKQLP